MPHQLFEALVGSLPAEGEVMTEQRRGAFLRTFDSMLDLVYMEPGQTTTNVQEGTPPLLLEAPPAAEVVPPKAQPKPAAKVTATTVKAAHTGRHLFRNGRCEKNGCGAVDPRGATDPKHNPFMQQPVMASTPTPAVAASEPPRTEATTAIRYCVIQGCHEAIGAGGRCADGHVQGGRG